MFYRRYSDPPVSSPRVVSKVYATEGGITHRVQMPGAVEAHRERLRQRHEEVLLQQQLMETEQELDGILEEEKELARRRGELQMLNGRQNEFHDRRLRLEDRINQAMLEFERESRQCQREERELEKAMATCRRYIEEMELLAPRTGGPLRGEAVLHRQLEFLAECERRLDEELAGWHEGGGNTPVREREESFGASFWAGARFFLPYMGLGAAGLLFFLSLTGGSR